MALGQRIILLSTLVILLWMSVGIFVYKRTFQLTDENNKILKPKSLKQEIEYCKVRQEKMGSDFWQKINLHENKVPQTIKESVSNIIVQSDSVIIEGTKIHYLYAKPKEFQDDILSVLLLHGQSYISETWNELGTIRTIAAFGYYPVAIDLPGYGQTSDIPDLNKVTFIDNIISSLNLKRPVLVSPSMSGSFSMRYLIKHPDKLGGFIPISPVQTSILNEVSCSDQEEDRTHTYLNEDCLRIMHYLKSKRPILNCIKVPSLIIWGEKDKGENSAKLCLLPESVGAEIPEGRHAAYMSNPELWHKLLYNFLNVINETRVCR